MLENTVCIVCGAGRGLGEATAKLMADYGAHVVVNDLGVEMAGGETSSEPAEATVDDISDAGGSASVHFGDVTDLEYSQQLIEDTVEEHGAVHNITNFAAILRDSMIFNMTEEEFDAVINVHLKGHFSLLRNASRHWRERYKAEELDRQRSFTCIGSGAANGNIGQANYSAAKAGILGLMRNGAHELHGYNIRVNAMWPGGITRMTEDILEQFDLADTFTESEYGTHLAAPLPVFLASEDAHDVTGCTIGLGGHRLSFMSHGPSEQRAILKDAESDGWSPDDIGDSWDSLTEGLDTRNTEYYSPMGPTAAYPFAE